MGLIRCLISLLNVCFDLGIFVLPGNVCIIGYLVG